MSTVLYILSVLAVLKLILIRSIKELIFLYRVYSKGKNIDAQIISFDEIEDLDGVLQYVPYLKYFLDGREYIVKSTDILRDSSLKNQLVSIYILEKFPESPIINLDKSIVNSWLMVIIGLVVVIGVSIIFLVG